MFDTTERLEGTKAEIYEELERQLGRKTLEVEVLKEALAVARVKKAAWPLPSPSGSSSR